MNHTIKNISGATRTMLCCAAALAIAAGLAGCRGERSDKPPRQFLPDMDDSPKFKPQAEAPFFEDGRAMRKPVVGTVAFGDSTDPGAPGRTWKVKDDPVVFEGLDPSRPASADGRPAYQAFLPAAVLDRVVADAAAGGRAMTRDGALAEMLDRGQQRYNIYCAACHGFDGEGGGVLDGRPYGGLVGQRWQTPVPSYHDSKYKDRNTYTGQDGYLFSVIRHGVPNADPALPPKMPSYADKINVPDSWAIVLYLRALQRARAEDLSDVPADERLKLEQTRPDSSRSDAGAPGMSIAAATDAAEVNP
ncbi:MAG: cytochrome c [Phycisphaeraceae bacterium]|nr:cytochrome c [Phycisphaeraceae bacterium]MBX3405495.1 cytochrome c [Phycisphaeraceae bacterium]